jgi:hypothetical protein
MNSRSTTRRDLLLATRAAAIPAPIPEAGRPTNAPLESPLVELGIGSLIAVVVALTAWFVAGSGSDLLSRAPMNGLGAPTCEADCIASPPPASAVTHSADVLPEQWHWEPEAYSFDEIYAQPGGLNAYRFDFVYLRDVPETAVE